MKKRFIILLFTFFAMGFSAFAADLPSKGKQPPALTGPGGLPPEPGDAPVGGGLVILLGMSTAYFLIKKKKQ